MPDAPGTRATIADIVRLTGYARSYVVRLHDTPGFQEAWQYRDGYPPVAAEFFVWIADETRSGYEKATPKNVLDLVETFREWKRQGGTMPLPMTGQVLPDMPLGDRITGHSDNRLTDNRSGQGWDALAVVRQMIQQELQEGELRAAERLADVLERRAIPAPDDELLTFKEVKERFVKSWGREKLGKRIPPVERGLWRKSDVLRYLASMGS